MQHLRAAAYVDERERPQRITLHLVNYGVPLGLNAPAAQRVGNVRVGLPLPPGLRADGVTLASPDEEDRSLQADTKDGVVRWVIPSLRVYAVCDIRLAQGP
jgi:hypothetical protein